MSKYMNVIVSWFNAILMRIKGWVSALPFPRKNNNEDDQNEVIEKVEAERVDPNAPLPLSDADLAETATDEQEEDAPKPGFIQRIKMKIYYFFFPPPMLVPVQLVTPEIDMEAESQPLPIRGQVIYMLIGAFFLIAVIWASLTSIDEVVRAEGAVVPSDNIKVVQTRLPGSVVDIHVSLGDQVEEGDVLFNIEDEDVKANFADNEIQRLTALASIYRLEAESKGLEQINIPEWLIIAAPDATQQELRFLPVGHGRWIMNAVSSSNRSKPYAAPLMYRSLSRIWQKNSLSILWRNAILLLHWLRLDTNQNWH